jgi:hypothetical protein
MSADADAQYRAGTNGHTPIERCRCAQFAKPARDE